MVQNILNIIVFGLVLSFLVFIHELGHFLAARWKKIRVEEFGLGYPPRAKTLFTKWGTIFSLNWVPFGGFVKMEGEDEVGDEAVSSTGKKSKQSEIGPFYAKSAGARLLVILAGATVNILFGILAFAIVFSIWGIPAGAKITKVESGLPAETIGLQPGMVITGLSVDEQHYTVRSAGEVSSLVRSHYGQEITVSIQNICDEKLCPETESYPVTLRTEEQARDDRGALGVGQEDYFQFYPWYEMPFRGAWFGLIQAVMLGALIIQALVGMVTDLLTRAIIPQEVMGPVGIVHETVKQDLVSQGFLPILLFAGLISINLGIMNVLPIPALDGGRAFFIILEKIVGKRHIAKVEGYANYGGFAFLIGLILLITARDIFRIVTGG